MYRKIPARRLPRRRPFRARGPARQNGTGRRRLLQEERPQCAGPTAQSGRYDQERTDGQRGAQVRRGWHIVVKYRVAPVFSDIFILEYCIIAYKKWRRGVSGVLKCNRQIDASQMPCMHFPEQGVKRRSYMPIYSNMYCPVYAASWPAITAKA
jgi:hypothetical protein